MATNTMVRLSKGLTASGSLPKPPVGAAGAGAAGAAGTTGGTGGTGGGAGGTGAAGATGAGRSSTASTTKPAPVVKKVDNEPKWTELKVKIVSGQNLPAMDSNGKSDPYLKFWCGHYKYKSKKKTKTLNPEWNEIIKPIPVSLCLTKPVEVECWDWDFIGSDTFMGQFSIDNQVLGVLEVGIPRLFTFSLEPKRKGAKTKSSVTKLGTVSLEITKVANPV
eukprot:TRINITY_DN2364_c0_g1_i1.p2 TRINITY_DN2364_c0_g1~~TRINITY_DN2364_c0_g1_i1.p2  ORF type:complete len:220 (-),score=74.05 TRINITY_DN2364_c0_g1_i1:88-747(-)